MADADSTYSIGPNLSPERCHALAAKSLLDIEDWIELTGVGIKAYRSYTVSSEGIHFNKFTDEDMRLMFPLVSAPIEI